MTSCNIDYENRLFYNETRLQELGLMPTSRTQPAVPIPPPPPVPSPLIHPRPISSASGNNNDNNRTRTIIIVVVSVAVSVILVTFAGFLLRKRTKQKPKEEINLNESSFVESLQCDFGVIRAATNNFSEANKLGQGGIGPIKSFVS